MAVGPLIRSKTRVPAVADAVIERRRVVEAIRRAAEGRSILQVVASAGSGKTTAVVQFLSSRPGPRAWLTLGEAEASPGRLATYLAAAVGAIDPEAPARTQEMLARGVAPADCAAVLAEGLPGGATLVIDDVHLVESRPPALSVLRALIEAVAPGALVVLVSRRLTHLNLSRAELTGRSGIVSGDELSFTDVEAGELLAAHGVEASPQAVSAWGGWAAGIVFGVLRAPRPTSGGAWSDDPFFAYLGAEVLDTLPARVRRTVMRSAILHTVDPSGLDALLEDGSGEAMFRTIRSHHLPSTLEPEGLRYHPRFREFLLSRLREDPDEMRTLLVRHARRLVSLGQLEEAADHLIEAGELGEAGTVVERAAEAVLLRGDWDKVMGWCASLGDEALSHSTSLRGFQLRAFTAGGHRSEGAAFVEALRHSGEYDRLVREDPEAATTAAFGLHFSMDWASLPDLLPETETSPGAHALRYVLEVGSGRTAPPPWRPREADYLSPSIGLFGCGLYFQGRLAEMERVDAQAAAANGMQPGIWSVASLRKRGLIESARRAFDTAGRVRWASGFDDFWRHMEAVLVFAEGDHARGLALVREARALTRSLGHQPADNAIFPVTEGKMLVRMQRPDEAVAVLRTARAWSEARGLPCFREWADTWLAAALLSSGAAPEEPIALLEEALEGMRTAERILEMPAAWVALAEARWRAGDEAGHHAAADGARAAALEMGTLAPLTRALGDFPDVMTRRAAGGEPGGTAWRTFDASPAPGPQEVRILLGTLGRPRVEVDGVEHAIAPLRALEVAADVARAGAEGLARTTLAEQVMDDSADAANYLRQVIHRLRRLAPAGVELVSENGRVRWSPDGAVVTEDQMLTTMFTRARGQIGETRRRTLAAALEIADRGGLIASDQNPRAIRRRDELAAAVSEARRDHAELLLDAGRADEALALARASVAEEPYREDGWRLLMRAAAASGGGSAAVPAYVDCVRALEGIGLTPSAETRALLERLRDSAQSPAAAL